MCHSHKILSRSKNGVLTFCGHSKLFRFVYNNLCFELYEWELEALRAYMADLDPGYWEDHLKDWGHPRKIPISVGKKHFIILVDREEVQEISGLLSPGGRRPRLLDTTEIDYRFFEN